MLHTIREAFAGEENKPLLPALVAASGVAFLLLLGVVFFLANLLPSVGIVGAVVSASAVVGLIWEPATLVLVLSRLILAVGVLGVAAISAGAWRNGDASTGEPSMQDKRRSGL